MAANPPKDDPKNDPNVFPENPVNPGQPEPDPINPTRQVPDVPEGDPANPTPGTKTKT